MVQGQQKWDKKFKDIPKEVIENDFHLQILTEQTIPKKRKRQKAKHTAELLNLQTGVDCVDFGAEV